MFAIAKITSQAKPRGSGNACGAISLPPGPALPGRVCAECPTRTRSIGEGHAIPDAVPGATVGTPLLPAQVSADPVTPGTDAGVEPRE